LTPERLTPSRERTIKRKAPSDFDARTRLQDPSRATTKISLNRLSLSNRETDLFAHRRSIENQKRTAMLITPSPKSVMRLLVSPLTRSDSGMNLSRDRRPIFYVSLKGFLDGQIRSMNRPRRRGMRIDGLHLVPAKPITMRLGKVQPALRTIKVGLVVGSKSASDAPEAHRI